MKLSIVIPARNEEANIEKMASLLFKNFSKQIDKLIVVNDCSTDSTKEILERLSKKRKKILPVHRRSNPGVGNAIRRGYKAVPRSSNYVLSLDCDFTENINDIKKMMKLASGSNADMVLGSRYVKSGKLVGYPFLKKVANRSFHLLARLIFGFKHVDVTNNFKLMKREVLKSIYPNLKSSGFSVNAETGLYPIILGFNVVESPVSWIGRTSDMGKSSFKVVRAGPGYLEVFLRAIKLKRSKIARILHKDTERKHFDSLVREMGETYYGNLQPIAKIRFQRKADIVLDLLKSYENPKVLEMGCGTGIFSEYILKKSPLLNIKGIDISPEAIKVAKRKLSKYKNANFEVGDVTKLSYRSKSFDVVIGNSALHHLDLVITLREIMRVLKPGGKMWFCEPNMLNPQIFLEKNIPIIKSLFQDSPCETAYLKQRLYKEIQRNGFTQVSVKPYEFLHPLIPKRLIKPATKTLIFLEKVPLLREFAGTLRIEAIK